MILAQTTQPDRRSFEITPKVPPVPALKYQLLFDNYMVRRPGNAAICYLRAALWQSQFDNSIINNALEAYDKGDMATFRKTADVYIGSSRYIDLDLGAHCEDCNWEDPMRDYGYKTLLPQLSNIRFLDRWIKMRAFDQLLDGKIDDALATARLGYELARNLGKETIVVSGLVSLSITRDMDEVLTKIMNDPRSPNLYWVLCDFPAQKPMLQRDWAGERLEIALGVPNMEKVVDGKEISADQWREVFDAMKEMVTAFSDPSPGPTTNPVTDSSPDILREARTHYSQNHHIVGNAINNIDPAAAIGEFYFLTYEAADDDLSKLSGLPYPLLLAGAKNYELQKWKQYKQQQPANIFLVSHPALSNAAFQYAFTDRQISGLMTVEAIRAYAAAHQNQLPAKLSDILDTPAPVNPATGLPFEYKVDGDHAVVADSVSEEPLEYTIKIRK
jgi:hypothetical protein